MHKASNLIQREADETRATLERLVEAGLLERRGSGRHRTYHFSASVYRELGEPDAYVRALPFEPLQIEQMILQYVRAHGHIARRDAAKLCRLTNSQASYRLQKMTMRGLLIRVGKGAATVYKEPSAEIGQ